MKLQALDQAALHKPEKQFPVQSVKNELEHRIIARD
jgi:hypothetical protein